VFFRDPQWAGNTDWQAELAPYYDQASRMLGVTRNPTTTPADEVVRTVAEQMGVGHTVTSTPVGVFYGEPGLTVPDPYFGGAGPERTGCTECGSCMTGCRIGGKNTLVKNYLYLAERAGAVIEPLTTVARVAPRSGGGWEVEAVRTGAWREKRTVRRWTCDQVVLAAGTYGTQRLMHAMKDDGTLPALSPRLGHQTRTNRGGARRDRAQGRRRLQPGRRDHVSFHLDEHTHVEPVRYGRGSNAIGLLQTVLVDGGGRLPRWLKALGVVARNPAAFVRTLSVRNWSERTVIALVMQSRDNSIVVSGRPGRWGGRSLTSRPGPGEPVPTWIPAGHEAVRRITDVIGGDPGGAFTDLVDIPMTAHFLGGCAIGATPADGVIDPYHRVHGYPGLSVVDGSAVSANLGVNPSLTITAQAERATGPVAERGGGRPAARTR
jgi:cholesterol oxidase